MFWSPSRASSVIVLGPSPAAPTDAPTLATLTAAASVRRDAADGAHILLPDRTQILVTDRTCRGPLAAHIPLEGRSKRAQAVENFARARRGLPPLRNSRRSRYAVDQLALRLRALDGSLEGASYREIAVGLFGAERVPAGAAGKVSDALSKAKRLVRDGRALMRGGYLALI